MKKMIKLLEKKRDKYLNRLHKINQLLGVLKPEAIQEPSTVQKKTTLEDALLAVINASTGPMTYKQIDKAVRDRFQIEMKGSGYASLSKLFRESKIGKVREGKATKYFNVPRNGVGKRIMDILKDNPETVWTPVTIFEKLKEHYPQLTQHDVLEELKKAKRNYPTRIEFKGNHNSLGTAVISYKL